MLVASLAVILAGTLFSVPAAMAGSPPASLSGAYVGAANASALSSFGSWRGSKATVAEDFLGDSNWSDISNPSWILSGWKSYVAGGGRLLLSVPMLTYAGGNFAAGAAGDYDGYFRSMGQALVADGEGNSILRLGWEFNGYWFPWSLTSSGSDSPTEFIAYWRHLVTLLRSIPGSSFKFDWNVNQGTEPINATLAYPGNSYVDYIGVEGYDMGYGVSTPQARWNQIVNQTYGLNWWLNFAREQGKPITIPEWGLSSSANGGGDDPYYIQQMYSWLKSAGAAIDVYYNYGSSVITSGAFPNAAASYRSLWG
ncbi:MAG TPA: glycosyl hydrolase [Solirubrobacteraceae bacterium]|nr:glycosyl hydrolase [Solirubrobacteraceae bacterium]